MEMEHTVCAGCKEIKLIIADDDNGDKLCSDCFHERYPDGQV